MIKHFRKEHIIRSFNLADGSYEDQTYFTNNFPSINAAKRASRQIGLGKVRVVEKLPEQPTN